MTDANLTVSVVLCTFNGARYVGEQINSILEQSHPVDEIVLADDGSHDGTVELVRDVLSKADSAPRLVVLPPLLAPLGVTANFERAAGASTGEIVILADQDDVWMSFRVANAVSLFRADPRALLAASDADLIDAAGAHLGVTLFGRMGVISEVMTMATPGGLRAALRRSVVPGMAIAFRRELIELAGAIPSSWPHDYWWITVAVYHDGFRLVGQALVKYRQHDSNVLGAGSRSFRVRLRRLLAVPSESAHLLESFSALSRYVSEVPVVDHEMKREIVEQRVDFERARVELPHNYWRRIPSLVRLLRRHPGYREFESNGRLNALRDISRPRSGADVMRQSPSHVRPVVVVVDRKRGRGGGQVVLEDLCARLSSQADIVVLTSVELANRLTLPEDVIVLTRADALPSSDRGDRRFIVMSNTNSDIRFALSLRRNFSRKSEHIHTAAVIHNHPKTTLHRIVTKLLLRRVQSIFPVEPSLANLSRRSVVLPWLSTSSVAGVHARSATFVVKCYARPDPTKGLDLLPKIFAELSERGIVCRVALGESLETHPEYVAALRARLAPWLENVPRTADWIDAGDIFLVPSIAGEAVCLSAQEAMARGAAVVASRIGLMPVLEAAGGAFRTFDIGDTAKAVAEIQNLLHLRAEEFEELCKANIRVVDQQQGRWYSAVIAHLIDREALIGRKRRGEGPLLRAVGRDGGGL